MEGLQATITNFSDIAWSLNNWHVGAGQSSDKNWPDEFTQVPDTTSSAFDPSGISKISSRH